MWNFTLEEAHVALRKYPQTPTLILTFVKLDWKVFTFKIQPFLLFRDKNSFICVSLRPFLVNHFLYLSLSHSHSQNLVVFVMEILILKPFKIKMRAHICTICGFASFFLISVYAFLRCLKNILPGDDWVLRCEHSTSLGNHQNRPHTFTSDAKKIFIKILYHDLDDLHINNLIRAENELIINENTQSMGTTRHSEIQI